MNKSDIQGWEDVVRWFGGEPNFHDAEIESIDLRRPPTPCVVRVHAWRTLPAKDERGYFLTDRHAILSFIMTGIVRQTFSDWAHQNVVFGLSAAKSDEGFALTIDPSFGVDGSITAKDMRVEIAPVGA